MIELKGEHIIRRILVVKSLENNVQYYAWHIVKIQFMFVEGGQETDMVISSRKMNSAKAILW